MHAAMWLADWMHKIKTRGSHAQGKHPQAAMSTPSVCFVLQMQRRHDHKVKDFPKNSYKSIYHNPSDQSDLQVFHLPCITDAAGYTGLHLLMLTGTYGLLKLQWVTTARVTH